MGSKEQKDKNRYGKFFLKRKKKTARTQSPVDPTARWDAQVRARALCGLTSVCGGGGGGGAEGGGARP